MEHDEARVIASSSLRRLLASHSSVYNALNNPDLDAATHHNESTGTLLPDLNFSVESWQAVSTPDVKSKRPTSSILLSISDDNDLRLEKVDSTVMIPYPKRVMVFETDEEEGPEDDELHYIIPPTRASPLRDAHASTFIMPKVAVPDSHLARPARLQVAFLSTRRFHLEAVHLAESITMSDVTAAAHDLDFPALNIGTCDLVFLINDGSMAVVEQIGHLLRSSEASRTRWSVVNMITENYFVNLFDLLSLLLPHQIWKASSLRNAGLHQRLQGAIELELRLRGDVESQVTSLIRAGLSRSVDASSKRPHYRLLERQFRHELELSCATLALDPLLLSAKCSYVNLVSSSIQQMPQLCWGQPVWLVCSFLVGIGLGFAIAGAGTAHQAPQLDPARSRAATVATAAKYDSITAPLATLAADCAASIEGIGAGLVEEITNTSAFAGLCDMAAASADYLRSLNHLLLEHFKGGVEKAFWLCVYAVH
jgi:hypothetical protein